MLFIFSRINIHIFISFYIIVKGDICNKMSDHQDYCTMLTHKNIGNQDIGNVFDDSENIIIEEKSGDDFLIELFMLYLFKLCYYRPPTPLKYVRDTLSLSIKKSFNCTQKTRTVLLHTAIEKKKECVKEHRKRYI